MEPGFRFIYVTTPTPEVAVAIGEKLVQDGLVACVNVLPGVTSIYRWDGRIVRDAESVLVAKTVEARTEAVISAVREAHPYACPCIVALPLVAGHPPFLAWIREQTPGPA